MTNNDVLDALGIKSTCPSVILRNEDEILDFIRNSIDQIKPKNRVPYSQFVPCICGTNRRERWFSKEGVRYVCKNCGLSVDGANEADAKRKWNAYMKRGAE